MTSNTDEALEQLCSAAAELHSQTRWLLTSDDNASDSESESDDEAATTSSDTPTNQMTDLVQSVRLYTDCLLDLGTALDCPALEPERQDEPKVVEPEQRQAYDYHTDLIEAKFPRAGLHLLRILGETSWKRYQRLQHERDANAHRRIPSTLGNKSHATSSDFKDSGVGTSLPPSSSYAETTLSFVTTVTSGKRVQIPSLCEEARKGAHFECNACGKLVRMKSNREWRFVQKFL